MCKKYQEGYSHTNYLKSDGTVWAVGSNNLGQLGDGLFYKTSIPVLKVTHSASNIYSNITAVAAGSHHTIYLRSDGTVLAKGLNNNGRLGDGTTTDRSDPVQVLDAEGSPLTEVVEISGQLALYTQSILRAMERYGRLDRAVLVQFLPPGMV